MCVCVCAIHCLYSVFQWAAAFPFDRDSVENESHCDFVKLREMLIRTNMEDMREKTHTRHYELYRQKRLEQMGFTDVDSENKPVSGERVPGTCVSACCVNYILL